MLAPNNIRVKSFFCKGRSFLVATEVVTGTHSIEYWRRSGRWKAAESHNRRDQQGRKAGRRNGVCQLIAFHLLTSFHQGVSFVAATEPVQR